METMLRQLEREFPSAVIEIRFVQSLNQYKITYYDDHRFSISKQPTSLEYFLTEEEMQCPDELTANIKQDEETYEK